MMQQGNLAFWLTDNSAHGVRRSDILKGKKRDRWICDQVSINLQNNQKMSFAS
jgi:hypothetical protein